MPFFQPLKTLTFTCAATALLTLSTPSIAQTSVQPIPATAESERSPAVRAIKSLVEQGRFADAFNLGLKNESLSGDPLYDYYFGIAAVDSGRPSLGVVALERVLLTNPDNDLARLELARGYFVLEDYERAKESFTRLLAKQLPPPVRGSIEKYLAAIRDKDPDFHTVIRGYAEFAIGHNSKMNSSGDTLVPVPYTFSQVGVQLSPTKAANTDWVRVIPPTRPVQPTDYAYAVPKGDSAWLARVNQFVAKIKQDGRLEKYATEYKLQQIVVKD